MSQRIFCVSDSSLKLSKNWFYPEVIEVFKGEQVELVVRPMWTSSLWSMKDAMERYMGSQTFDCVIVLCMGWQIGSDLETDVIAEMVPFLRAGKRNLVLYGGMSEWWKQVPNDFEQMANEIRSCFRAFPGVNCHDGRCFYTEAHLTKEDFDDGNHIVSDSRWKGVAWFTQIVRAAANGYLENGLAAANGYLMNIPPDAALPTPRPTKRAAAVTEAASDDDDDEFKEKLLAMIQKCSGQDDVKEDGREEATPPPALAKAPPGKRQMDGQEEATPPPEVAKALPGKRQMDGKEATPPSKLAKAPPGKRQANPLADRDLICANPRCWFLVHTKPSFGNFCCGKCHYLWENPSKVKKKHGHLCERRPCTGQARANPMPPTDLYGT